MDQGKGGRGVMATVPKRSTQRRHRIKVDITHVPAEDEVEIPAASTLWHPIARRWYESLGKSGQRIFYENSDWAQAFYVAEVMSRNLTVGTCSSNLFSAVIHAATELLTTEGSRRRMRVELERAAADGDTTAATAMAAYKQIASVA